MTAVPEYKTRRTAQYIARNFLLMQGFEVIRVAERQNQGLVPLHLVAWKRETGILFICVRSSRTGNGILEDISNLSSLISIGRYPDVIQYWIREHNRWIRYQIYSGGAVQIREAGDAPQ